MNLVKQCIKDLKDQEIYQWNDYYPTVHHITESMANNTLYILEENNEYTGIVSLTEEQPSEYKILKWEDHRGKAIVITKLMVNPKFQQMGYGRKLMDFAENSAKIEGYTSVRLDAYSGNLKAIKLYEDRKYKKIGKVWFPHRELPFYCYEKLF